MPGSTFVGGSIDIHVRFEALGGNARRAQIFRRHEDLQRAYEHEVKGLARETRHVTSKLSRIQSEHLTRMRAIQKLEPQSFRDNWPSIEERRAIIAQMQDGLPLLTGASLSQHASPSKAQDSTPKKQRLRTDKNKIIATKADLSTVKNDRNKFTPPKTSSSVPKNDRHKMTPPKPSPSISENGVNKMTTPKSNSKTRRINGMLSKPHFAQPKSLSDPSLISKKVQANEVKNHSSENNSSLENPRTEQHAPKEQSAPAIILSHADGKDPQLQNLPNPHSGVVNSTGRPNGSFLHPGSRSFQPGLSPRGDTGISSNRSVPRRRWRSRQPWNKHEEVLLFKIEAREGKETYTQVAQRKYPSYI